MPTWRKPSRNPAKARPIGFDKRPGTVWRASGTAGTRTPPPTRRMNRLEQEVAQLRKEIAKLQQSESIVQAALLDMRKTLTAVQTRGQQPSRASPFSGTDEREFRPRLQHARLVAAGRAEPAARPAPSKADGESRGRPTGETLAPRTPENPALGGYRHDPREDLSRAKNGL